jgi:hypothetical protein
VAVIGSRVTQRQRPRQQTNHVVDALVQPSAVVALPAVSHPRREPVLRPLEHIKRDLELADRPRLVKLLAQGDQSVAREPRRAAPLESEREMPGEPALLERRSEQLDATRQVIGFCSLDCTRKFASAPERYRASRQRP